MTIRKKGEGTRYVPPGHDTDVSALKLFNPSTGCAKADAHLTTFAPGSGMAEEVHPASDHIFLVMSGSFEVRQGGRVVAALEEGDAVHIPAGEVHQIVNTGKVPGTFYAVTVPPV